MNTELERGAISVAGVRRTYWLARGRPRGPLMIVLHGSGMDGETMARFTGLAARGPAAGITTVFPDGWKGTWHAAGVPDRVADVDDTLFLAALASRLEVQGAAQSWPVFLAGVSTGALFAEHIARHGLLRVGGLFLVAGTALEVSRRSAPQPLLRTRTVIVMGTGDRSVPYQGGRLTGRGLTGALKKLRAARRPKQPGDDVVAAAEDIAADWASGNGSGAAPLVVEELAGDQPDLPVTRKTWSAPGCHPVTLYRISGGGHGWPGGSQFLPARVAGQVSRGLDATGILLTMAQRAGEVPLGRPLASQAARSATA